jgi:hypothetical protein
LTVVVALHQKFVLVEASPINAEAPSVFQRLNQRFALKVGAVLKAMAAEELLIAAAARFRIPVAAAEHLAYVVQKRVNRERAQRLPPIAAPWRTVAAV